MEFNILETMSADKSVSHIRKTFFFRKHVNIEKKPSQKYSKAKAGLSKFTECASPTTEQ